MHILSIDAVEVVLLNLKSFRQFICCHVHLSAKYISPVGSAWALDCWYLIARAGLVALQRNASSSAANDRYSDHVLETSASSMSISNIIRERLCYCARPHRMLRLMYPRLRRLERRFPMTITRDHHPRCYSEQCVFGSTLNSET